MLAWTYRENGWRLDSQRSPVWRIIYLFNLYTTHTTQSSLGGLQQLVQGKCPRQRPQLRYKEICKWDLKAFRNGPQEMGNLDIGAFSLEAGSGIMASPNLKRPLSSRPRPRGSHKSSKTRELDRGQVAFVFSVEGIVTL